MANASQKRIASQNEAAIRNLRLGLAIPTVLHILLRLLFRRSSLPPSKGSLALYVFTFIPTFFLGRYLEKIGTVKRDAAGGLMSSGEDLSQPGLTEYCFDVLYVTWACQVGSGAFGDKFWYLYLVIPLYAGFKLWTSFISPFVLGRSSRSAAEDADTQPSGGTSKRQEKLRKRAEKGDPRVKQQTSRR